MALAIGRVDFKIQDSAGNVIRDSKAERIADDPSLLNLLAPKLQESATLEGLVASYSKAVGDLPMNLYICRRFATQFQYHYGTRTPRARLCELAKAIGNA